MLVYVEYISRRGHVSLPDFHAIAKSAQEGWAKSYSDDVLVLNLGRTWRLGPEPEYLAVWYSPSAGLERLSDWEQAFSSGEADHFEKPMELAARLDAAGCYEPLTTPVRSPAGRFYAEFFDFALGATKDEVRASYLARQRHNGLEMPLLADRIGHLGPDPRGLCVWKLSSYDDLEELATELEGINAPVILKKAALYAPLGEEVL